MTAVAGVLLWLIASPGPPAARNADAAAQVVVDRRGSFVCMAADGELWAPTGLDCRPGQTLVPLDSGNAEGCKEDPWKSKDDADSAGDALGEIESRLKAIENAPLFEVVDREGRPIFQVLPCEIAMSNAAGDRVLMVNGEEAGGFLTVTNQSNEAVSIGAVDENGGVLITQDGFKRLEYGRPSGKNYALRLPMGHVYTAAIGESLAGSGAIVVGDDFGRPRAMLSVVDGKGRIMTENKDGSPVLSMTEGESGSGMLVIGDSSSEPMVKFSVTDNRYGAVLAGPVSGFPTVPGSGLPGSYILGCAGGPACGPGGGGRQR